MLVGLCQWSPAGFVLTQSSAADLFNKQSDEDHEFVDGFLGLDQNAQPESDHASFQSRWTAGTSEWILKEPSFRDWSSGSGSSSVLWLSLPPASGKSTIMSFIINDMLQSGQNCQYFYFRYSEATKKSTVTLLKSPASQIAQQHPRFRTALKGLAFQRSKLSSVDAQTLWQKLYIGNLFKINDSKPLFWIIDGLDESESPTQLLNFLSHIALSQVPIEVMISSRATASVSQAFRRLGSSIRLYEISTGQSIEADIKFHTIAELHAKAWDQATKEEVANQVLRRSNGSFLWVRLALKQVLRCHTPDDIRAKLDEMPPGMEDFYKQMEVTLINEIREEDLPLANTILSWAAFSRRPLSLDELQGALHPSISNLMEPRNTVNEVCGQFASMDASDRLAMLHQTARDYLVGSAEKLVLDPSTSHARHAVRCLRVLRKSPRRPSREDLATFSFREYASTGWPHQLRFSDVAHSELIGTLLEFLKSRDVSDWIQTIASISSLDTMVEAARSVNELIRKQKKYNTTQSPLLHRLNDIQELEDWSLDLMRIVGRFSETLRQAPSAIHKLIPPFCPTNSMISRQNRASVQPLSSTTVEGITMTDWDDHVGRLATPDSETRLVQCTTDHIAVATTRFEVWVWDASNFGLLHILVHGEATTTMCFTTDGTKLASTGFYSTKLHELATGETILDIQNPSGTRTLASRITLDDQNLVAAFDDGSVRSLSLNADKPAWIVDFSADASRSVPLPHGRMTAPCAIALDLDAQTVALAYRSAPLSVWNVESAALVGRCYCIPQTWDAVHVVTWHPRSEDLLGIYSSGSIFKWNPYEDRHQGLPGTAKVLSIAPSGAFFLASDTDDTIKIYSFEHFAPIYHIGVDDLITDLAVSPDGSRHYDLRGSCCNMWEPEVLAV